MGTHSTTDVDDSELSPGVIPWESIERHRASAFVLAGGSTIASVIVPGWISALTDWAWASGLLLVGFAVTAVAVGLLGLYPPTAARAPRLALAGAVSAGIAAVAALTLVATTGIVLVAELGLGTNVPRPTDVFGAVALSMAGGFALGFLSFGFAVRRTITISRSVGHLLVGGGSLLLVPVVVETLGLVYSVSTPPWVLLLALGAVAVDTFAIGYLLSRGGPRER